MISLTHPNIFQIRNKKYVIRKVINNTHELISYLDVGAAEDLIAWRLALSLRPIVIVRVSVANCDIELCIGPMIISRGRMESERVYSSRSRQRAAYLKS